MNNSKRIIRINKSVPGQEISGVTLIELLISSVLMILVLGMGVWAIRLLSPEGKMNPEVVLNAERDARRINLELFSEITEGIEILRPRPGSTTPFMLYVNYQNEPVMLYQRRNNELSQINNHDTYNLYRRVNDYGTGGGGGGGEELLYCGLKHLSFTAHSDSSVLITGEIVEGWFNFPLMSFVRLNNYESENTASSGQ